MHWPASWRWCCTACSGTEPTSFLARQRQPWPEEEGCNNTGFRAGHTISPPEQGPFAGTMDGLGRSEVSSPSGLRVSRLANRSSADPIKQRPRVDCGQKQALGEGLGSKGIDSLKPVTEATSLCHGAGRYSPLMGSQEHLSAESGLFRHKTASGNRHSIALLSLKM